MFRSSFGDQVRCDAIYGRRFYIRDGSRGDSTGWIVLLLLLCEGYLFRILSIGNERIFSTLKGVPITQNKEVERDEGECGLPRISYYFREIDLFSLSSLFVCFYGLLSTVCESVFTSLYSCAHPTLTIEHGH